MHPPGAETVPTEAETKPKLTTEALIRLHNAIHHGANSQVELNGNIYPIHTSTMSDCKYIWVHGYKFLEQNPNKHSFYAHKAKAGSKITWIVYPNRERRWGLIENGAVLRF
tara:strand:+ start:244 stop:576 length:333 start_codon:yes stop_codon:yes gene_type:complete